MPNEIENTESEEEIVTCSNCNCEIEDENNQNDSPDGVMCETCYNETYTCCDECGNVVESDNTEYVDEKTLCQRCLNRYYIHCDNCGDWIHRDYSHTVENDELCDTCNDNETEYCDDCGETFYQRHFNDGDIHDCMDNKHIHDYNYKPEPEFFGDGQVFYGVELEVECENDVENDAARLENHSDFVYLKRDGSLNDGFEIVSHPASLQYHQNNHWQAICKVLTDNKVRSHDTRTCGLYVHMSRNGMDEKHIKKFVMFWYTQNKIIQSVARRGFNHYCQDKTLEMGKGRMKFVPDSVMLRSETRYEQINFSNTHTIEVRRFKGTLNPITLLACIELVDAVREFTKTCQYKFLHEYEQTEKYFVAWLFSHKKVYPNLFDRVCTKMNIEFESTQE